MVRKANEQEERKIEKRERKIENWEEERKNASSNKKIKKGKFEKIKKNIL